MSSLRDTLISGLPFPSFMGKGRLTYEPIPEGRLPFPFMRLPFPIKGKGRLIKDVPSLRDTLISLSLSLSPYEPTKETIFCKRDL